MKQIRLSPVEKKIERALINGEYVKVEAREFEEIARMIAHRRKDAVLNVRINSDDLKSLKQKSKRLGIKYQTFISELLHRVAHI